jgi:hypothetical protein
LRGWEASIDTRSGQSLVHANSVNRTDNMTDLSLRSAGVIQQ